MDCKIYLQDSQTVVVQNVANVKAVPYGNDKTKILMWDSNDENKNPVAAFFDITGYEIRR